MGIPDLSKNFPNVDQNLKIKSDLENRVHGTHYDIMQAIENGSDQLRISPLGEILGGTTNIGKTKMDW